LAIPDLIVNLYFIGMYGIYANQNFNPEFRTSMIFEWETFDDNNVIEWNFVIAYTTANLYLNAVVSYEVLVLLRNSHQARRSDPPSLLKVTMQAAALYVFAILVTVIIYFISIASLKDYYKGDFDRSNYILESAGNLFLLVSLILPLVFVCSVCIISWCRGYMPSMNGMSVRGRAMRELAWYFFRIIAVFFACWVFTFMPSMSATSLEMMVTFNAKTMGSGCLCLGLQLLLITLIN
jgi:hypothetical protein